LIKWIIGRRRGGALDFCPLRLVPRSRLAQSLGLCFHPLLKCLRRFIVLPISKL
jgi:hypothetical protein